MNNRLAKSKTHKLGLQTIFKSTNPNDKLLRKEVMSAINWFACRHQVTLPQIQQFSSRSSCFHKAGQVSNTLQTAMSFARTTFIICISYIYLFIHDLHCNQALPRVLNSNARSLSVFPNILFFIHDGGKPIHRLILYVPCSVEYEM